MPVFREVNSVVFIDDDHDDDDDELSDFSGDHQSRSLRGAGFAALRLQRFGFLPLSRRATVLLT